MNGSEHVQPVGEMRESVVRGLADSAAGRVVDLGDFTQYVVGSSAPDACGVCGGSLWRDDGGWDWCVDPECPPGDGPSDATAPASVQSEADQ